MFSFILLTVNLFRHSTLIKHRLYLKQANHYLIMHIYFISKQSRIDPLLLNYVELGLVENLKWRYLGKARLCESALGLMLSGRTTQYSLNHTGGLFLVLLVAVGVSLLVLVFEHVVYFVLLPRLKKMPNNSIWKNRNIEFFSQVTDVDTVRD